MLGYIWSLDCIGMDIYILMHTSVKNHQQSRMVMSTHKRTQLLRSIRSTDMQVTYAYTYTTHSETKKWPPCKGCNISRVVYIYPICPLAPALARRILFYLCDYCQINHRPELQVSIHERRERKTNIVVSCCVHTRRVNPVKSVA